MTTHELLRTQWDRALAISVVLLGGVAFLLGWLGVSATGYLTEQLPYVISGGLVGIALVIIGASLWLSADVRDEWRKLDALQQQLDRLTPSPADA